jgi:hypothetical protein
MNGRKISLLYESKSEALKDAVLASLLSLSLVMIVVAAGVICLWKNYVIVNSAGICPEESKKHHTDSQC